MLSTAVPYSPNLVEGEFSEGRIRNSARLSYQIEVRRECLILGIEHNTTDGSAEEVCTVVNVASCVAGGRSSSHFYDTLEGP